jgi:hypothetical protein
MPVRRLLPLVVLLTSAQLVFTMPTATLFFDGDEVDPEPAPSPSPVPASKENAYPSPLSKLDATRSEHYTNPSPLSDIEEGEIEEAEQYLLSLDTAGGGATRIWERMQAALEAAAMKRVRTWWQQQ